MAPLNLADALEAVLGEAFGDPDGWSIPKIRLELKVKFKVTVSQAKILGELRRHRERFFELDGKWKRK